MSANFTYLKPGWQASSKIKGAVKRNILAHVSFNLGIQETMLCGVRLLNKLSSGQTMLRALLQIPSLTPMTNKDSKIISGRVLVSFQRKIRIFGRHTTQLSSKVKQKVLLQHYLNSLNNSGTFKRNPSAGQPLLHPHWTMVSMTTAPELSQQKMNWRSQRDSRVQE